MGSDSAWDIETSFTTSMPEAANLAGKSAKTSVCGGAGDQNSRAPVAHRKENKSLPKIDKFVGFNPYDTGALYIKSSDD